jgi:hypothetical protein
VAFGLTEENYKNSVRTANRPGKVQTRSLLKRNLHKLYNYINKPSNIYMHMLLFNKVNL